LEEKESFSFICPECGYPLSVDFAEDENEEMVLKFFCEGPGEDTFNCQIRTGVDNEDIAYLEIGKPLITEATTELLNRQSGKDYKAEMKRKQSK
jgi:hypothetical protein